MTSEAPPTQRLSPRHLHLPLPPGTPVRTNRAAFASVSPRTSAPSLMLPSFAASPVGSSSRGMSGRLPLPPVSRFSTRRSQQETSETKKEHGKGAAPIDTAAVTSHSPSLPNRYTPQQEDTPAQVRAEPAPVEETSPTTTTPASTPALEEPTEEPSSSASQSVAAPKTEDAPLPPGWVQLFTDAPDPVPYYLHEPNGTTQWERPSVPQVVPPASVAAEVVEPWPHETADALPDGWVQCSTTDAPPVPYYLYEPDGTTQWERPAVEGPVQPVGDAEHKDPPAEEVVAPAVEKAAPHHAEPEGWLPPCTEENEPYYVDAPADGTTPWTTAARMPEWEGDGPVERSAAEAPMPAAATPPPEEDMELSSEAPLPVGWVALWTEEKEPYYLYAPDGRTQWDRPTVDPPSGEPPNELPESTAAAEPEAVLPPNELPESTATAEPEYVVAPELGDPEEDQVDVLREGWVRQYTDDQEPYYLYEPDGTTQWERPASAVRPEVPPEDPATPLETEEAAAAHGFREGDDALPEGWVQQLTENNEPYYLYEPDGTTQWERPTTTASMPSNDKPLEQVVTADAGEAVPEATEHVAPPAGIQSDDPLPEGWIQQFTEDQEPYYLYEPDGTTQWERPTAAAAMPLNDEGQQNLATSEMEEVAPEPPAAWQGDVSSQQVLLETDHQVEMLPAGWVRQFTEENEPYYLFEPDGTTQWERPTGMESLPPQVDDVVPSTVNDVQNEEMEQTNAMVEPEFLVAPDVPSDEPTSTMEHALPDGWVELCTEDNERYYLYEPDGTTQWDRPQSSQHPLVVAVDESPGEYDESAVSVRNEETLYSEQIGSNPEVTPPHPQSSDTPETMNTEAISPPEDNTNDLVDLPDGWIELWTDENIPYYLYEPDGSTQWERPDAAIRSEKSMNGENEHHMYSLDEPLAAVLVADTILQDFDATTRNVEESVDEDENNDVEIVDEEDDAYNYVAVLPPGWKEGFDDASGKPYYYSEIDGTIEWVRPTIDNDENGVMEVVGEPATMSNPSSKEVESSEVDSEPALSSEPLPMGWVEIIDEATGMPYYMNEVDGSTSWDRPATQPELAGNDVSDELPSELQNGESLSNTLYTMEDLAPVDSLLVKGTEEKKSSLPPGWVEVYDEDAGMPYFYDEVNDVATWERPHDENIQSSAIESLKDDVAEPERDIVIDDYSVDKFPSKQDYSLGQADPTSDLPPVWSKVVDDSSGQVYFYCEVDGSTSWDPPPQPSVENHGQVASVFERSDAYESGTAPETTGQEGPRSLPSGWKELSDSDTGQVYYYNESTGVSSWEFPCEVLGNDDLAKVDGNTSAIIDETDASKVASDMPDVVVKSRANIAAHMASDPRHCIGRPAHAAASFGFGGSLCQLQSVGPSGSDVVVIRRLYTVTPNELLVKIEGSKRQHGLSGPFNVSDENSVSAYVNYKASHFDDLLWSLVSTASISQGKLRSKAGVADSSSPEALIVQLLLRENAMPRSSDVDKKMSPVQGDADDEFTMQTVENLLLEGQTERAVTEAIKGGQFALALIIARCCGHDVYARAVQSFADQAIPASRPLHTISLLLSGQLHPAGQGLTLPWNGISHVELVVTWKNHLAAILSNRTEEWSQLALSLGDRLYECGEIIFAHFCYMVGGSSLGSAVSNAKMVLLGCDFSPWDVVLASDESVMAFERTEAYEWAKRRGNPLASIHSLQALKVMYAMLLADFGFMDAAKLYVDSALHCLDVSREQMQALEHENGLLSCAILTSDQTGLLASLNCLDRRLTCSIRPVAMEIGSQNSLCDAPVDTSIENDANASFVTAHTTFNDVPLAPEALKRLDVVPLKENRDRLSPPPSRSAMVVPLQPIDEGNSRVECDTPVNAPKQNALLTPSKPIHSSVEVNHHSGVDINQKAASILPSASGGTSADIQGNKTPAPKLEVAPSSAPANLQSSIHKSASSAPAPKKKGFLNFGIKDKVTKWLNPDATTADLGEGMDAYYDEKLKRWVFPGDNLEELAKPLGPPPTAPMTTPQSVSDDKSSGTGEAKDPLAAMMAPPQRGPSRSRGSSASIRPSPASMPILFPPGMAMPTPGASTDSTAAPALTKFSVFTPPTAPAVPSDDAKEHHPTSE